MIRLRTLGTLDLRGSAGEEVRAVLAQPRRAALLAYLALALPRGVQRRDTILALFWPELDIDRARNALGQALHFLRRAVGESVIVSRNGDGLAVDWDNFSCDAAAFEDALDANRVDEAVALYRGDLLHGFHIDDAPEFERWLDAGRARLAARYTKAVETLALGREAAGDFIGAAAHWRVIHNRDPYNSRVTLRLMRVLKGAGDPAGALILAREHEGLLRDELGIAPDAEIAALVRQLQAEPAAGPPPPVGIRPSAAEGPAAPNNLPAASEPPAPERSRRRTAVLTSGFLLAAAIAGVAVLKSGSGAAPVDAPTVISQSLETSDGLSTQAFLREMYVRGRNAAKSRSEIGFATAREAYERAIARDPSFALGYAGLAEVYELSGHYGYQPIRPALDSAGLMARRGFALDSMLAGTRSALAVTLATSGDFDAAEREFKRAIELDSNHVLAHQRYSFLLIALGRGTEAQREADRAVKLDPLGTRGVLAPQRFAHWLITGERPHLRLPVKERRPWIKVEPGDPWPYARQAEELAQAGECEGARKDLERAVHLAPNSVRMRPSVAEVEWWCGERGRARVILDEMKRRPDAADNGLQVANLHTLFGEKDSAFVWLSRHSHWTLVELAALSAGPVFDPLRSDPRLLELQRRLRIRR